MASAAAATAAGVRGGGGAGREDEDEKEEELPAYPAPPAEKTDAQIAEYRETLKFVDLERKIQVRQAIGKVLVQARRLLEVHAEDQDLRMRSEDLLTSPMDNPHIEPATVSGKDLERLKRQIERVIAAGEACGLTEKRVRRARNKLQDARELYETYAHLRTTLHDRDAALENVSRACQQIVDTAGADDLSDEQISKLQDTIDFALQTARFLAIEEERIYPLQTAHDAFAQQDEAMLTRAIEEARAYVMLNKVTRQRAEDHAAAQGGEGGLLRTGSFTVPWYSPRSAEPVAERDESAEERRKRRQEHKQQQQLRQLQQQEEAERRRAEEREKKEKEAAKALSAPREEEERKKEKRGEEEDGEEEEEEDEDRTFIRQMSQDLSEKQRKLAKLREKRLARKNVAHWEREQRQTDLPDPAPVKLDAPQPPKPPKPEPVAAVASKKKSKSPKRAGSPSKFKKREIPRPAPAAAAAATATSPAHKSGRKKSKSPKQRARGAVSPKQRARGAGKEAKSSPRAAVTRGRHRAKSKSHDAASLEAMLRGDDSEARDRRSRRAQTAGAEAKVSSPRYGGGMAHHREVVRRRQSMLLKRRKSAPAALLRGHIGDLSEDDMLGENQMLYKLAMEVARLGYSIPSLEQQLMQHELRRQREVEAKQASVQNELRHAMLLAVEEGTHMLSALHMTLMEVQNWPDLVSPPPADSPMRRNNVSEADLMLMSTKVEDLLRQATLAGLPSEAHEAARYTAQQVEDIMASKRLRAIKGEVDVHIQAREAAAAEAQAVLIDSQAYPFGTSYGPSPFEDGIDDAEIRAINERMTAALKNARLAGVREDQLIVLQDVYDSLCKFAEGRVRVKIQLLPLLDACRDLRARHPRLLDAPAMLEDAQHLSEERGLGAMFDGDRLRGVPADDNVLTFFPDEDDVELVSVGERVHAVLAGYARFAIAQDDHFHELQRTMRSFEAYLMLRSKARAVARQVVEKGVERLTMEQAEKLLHSAQNVGLYVPGDARSKARKMTKTEAILSKIINRIQELQIGGGGRAKRWTKDDGKDQKSGGKPSAAASSSSPSSSPRKKSLAQVPTRIQSSLEQLDKKLVGLVPITHQRLKQAIQSKDPVQLEKAIRASKRLEQRLEKLRALRKMDNNNNN